MNQKIKILFTVSVVANVLLLGIFGGMAYRHMNTHSWHQVRQSLAPETRHMMARVFQKNHKELKPVISQARAQKKRLMKILLAERFDKDAFAREAKRLQKSQAKIRAAKIVSMGEMAVDLPLEERRKLSKMFEKSLGDRKHRGKHRKMKHRKRDGESEGRRTKAPVENVPIPAHRPE